MTVDEFLRELGARADLPLMVSEDSVRQMAINRLYQLGQPHGGVGDEPDKVFRQIIDQLLVIINNPVVSRATWDAVRRT
jgi:hypothetical protein